MTRSKLKSTLRRIYVLLVRGARHLVPRQDRRPCAGAGRHRLGEVPQGRLRVPARHVAADRHRRRRLHHQRVPEALELRGRRSRRSGATSSPPSRRCSPTPSSSGRRSSSTSPPSAGSPRPSTTCARSTATSARPTTSSASTPTRRCTTCAARCRRSIRARTPIRMPRRAIWCATPSCSRSTPCARRSWRSWTWRSRTIRC